MPVDRPGNSTQSARQNLPNRDNNARTPQVEYRGSRQESQPTDRIDLTKELEAFRKDPDKGELSLKGYTLGNDPMHLFAQIAKVAGSNLKTLNLSNCKINKTIDISPLKNSNLETLILMDNPTKKITGFEKLPKLKTIDLSNTEASKAPQSGEYSVDISPYARARKLEVLSIANCGITTVTGLDKFKKHPNLKRVNLMGNRLSDIPAGFFLLPWRDILFETNALSTIAEIEYEIGVRLNPGHNVHNNYQISPFMRNTRMTLNAAEQNGKEMIQSIEAIAQKDLKMSDKLQARLYPHIQTQMISDQLESMDTLFRDWEKPELQGSIDQKLVATARYRRTSRDAARALLYGSIALRPMENRPNVSNAVGWNAVSKIAHGALSLGSTVAGQIPHIGGVIAASVKGIDTLLGVYSSYLFNKINRAVSQILEQNEVEPFCDAFSRGAALMMARTLQDKRSWLEEHIVDEFTYRSEKFSGNAADLEKKS